MYIVYVFHLFLLLICHLSSIIYHLSSIIYHHLSSIIYKYLNIYILYLITRIVKACKQVHDFGGIETQKESNTTCVMRMNMQYEVGGVMQTYSKGCTTNKTKTNVFNNMRDGVMMQRDATYDINVVYTRKSSYA